MLVYGTAKTIISSKNFFQSSKTTGPRWYQFRCCTKNHSIPPLFFVDYLFWGLNEYKSPLNARKSREIKKSGWTSLISYGFRCFHVTILKHVLDLFFVNLKLLTFIFQVVSPFSLLCGACLCFLWFSSSSGREINKSNKSSDIQCGDTKL